MKKNSYNGYSTSWVELVDIEKKKCEENYNAYSWRHRAWVIFFEIIKIVVSIVGTVFIESCVNLLKKSNDKGFLASCINAIRGNSVNNYASETALSLLKYGCIYLAAVLLFYAILTLVCNKIYFEFDKHFNRRLLLNQKKKAKVYFFDTISRYVLDCANCQKATLDSFSVLKSLPFDSTWDDFQKHRAEAFINDFCVQYAEMIKNIGISLCSLESLLPSEMASEKKSLRNAEFVYYIGLNHIYNAVYAIASIVQKMRVITNDVQHIKDEFSQKSCDIKRLNDIGNFINELSEFENQVTDLDDRVKMHKDIIQKYLHED